MPAQSDARENLASQSAGFQQIAAVADARLAEVVLAVTVTHAGKPYTDVEAALRSRFAAAGVPVPERDLDTMIRKISDARSPE